MNLLYVLFFGFYESSLDFFMFLLQIFQIFFSFYNVCMNINHSRKFVDLRHVSWRRLMLELDEIHQIDR